MKKIFTFVLITLFLMFFGFNFNKAYAGNSLTLLEEDSLTLTESKDYGDLMIDGNLTITNNAIIGTNRINIGSAGSITIEEGATLKLNNATFRIVGKLHIKGSFIGEVANFSYDSNNIILYENGIIYIKSTTSNPYFSYTVYELKRLGCDANSVENTLCAFGSAHKHNYDENGICTNCKVPGCVIGYLSHDNVDNVCKRCGIEGPVKNITRDQTTSSLYVEGHYIIKSGATVKASTVQVNTGTILTIEEGAKLVVNGSAFIIRGKIVLNGTLEGESNYFSFSGSLVASENCFVNIKFSSYSNARQAHTILKNSGVEATMNNNNYTVNYANPNHVHSYENYVCTKCGAIDKTHAHNYSSGVCTICEYKCPHDFTRSKVCPMCGMYYCDTKGGHKFKDGKCTECGYKCENTFHNNEYECPDCGMRFDARLSGTILSNGSVAIIIGLGIAAAFFTLGLVFGKKKKTEDNAAE